MHPAATCRRWTFGALALAGALSVGAARTPSAPPDATRQLPLAPALPRRAADVPTYRLRARNALEQVMGPLPAAGRRVPLQVRVLRAETLATYTREDITFVPEAGDRATACLLIPRGLEGRAPAVLCLHEAKPQGNAEVVDTSRMAPFPYGRELAERGYVVLATNYPNYDGYRCDAYSLGYESTTMKGIWNRVRAVDLLRSLPEVDPERIAVVGHSLGGHNALFSADFDPRIRAVVASCAFTGLVSYAREHQDLSAWSVPQYMPRIRSRFRDDPRRMPFGFVDVLALVSPRPVLVVAGRRDGTFDIQGVRSCVERARGVFGAVNAASNLDTLYFDGFHDFPPVIRRAAYEWLDRQLGVRSRSAGMSAAHRVRTAA